MESSRYTPDPKGLLLAAAGVMGIVAGWLVTRVSSPWFEIAGGALLSVGGALLIVGAVLLYSRWRRDSRVSRSS